MKKYLATKVVAVATMILFGVPVISEGGDLAPEKPAAAPVENYSALGVMPYGGGWDSTYGPGTQLDVGGHSLCTLALAGWDRHGNKIGITAGHCGGAGDRVSVNGGGGGAGGYISHHMGGTDASVVVLDANATVTRSYNGVTVNGWGGGMWPGQQVCKQGAGTGFTCGPVIDPNTARVCSGPGDSGGPVLAGDRVVAVVAGGRQIGPAGPCYNPGQPDYWPMATSNIDAVIGEMNAGGGAGSGFVLA